MNEKEENVLKEIINYVHINKTMPTRRWLQNKLGYKSVTSITWFINSLLKQNYLIRNNEGKVILNDISNNFEQGLKEVDIINSKNEKINLYLNKNKKYIAYKIHHNFFLNDGIIRNDILIIKINNKLKNNDLGLFVIDNKYRIMKYKYQDGFYILKDFEEIILHQVKIIGKVIIIERKL